MSSSATLDAEVSSGIRRFIERVLPWYDVKVEAARNARTEGIRQRSIAARIAAEEVRLAYMIAAERARRRRL